MKAGLLWLALPVFAGCSPDAPPSPPLSSAPATSATAAPIDPLSLPIPRAELDALPGLRDRVLGSPFGYFRYVNPRFLRAVCDKYAGSIGRMPTVNLHGDAHIEQYAVAADGRGLADFDATTMGPPIVDLVRFATSLQLASSDDAGAERAIQAFLRGYETALHNPEATAPEPVVATRIRATFAPTAREWLDRVEQLMVPLDADKQKKLEQARVQYVGAMLAQNPDLKESFFAMKRGGALKMGVGSAHEKKFLGRFEGPTSLPDDDMVVEMKEMVAVPADTCVRGADRDPLRVVVGQSRLALSPQRFLGYVDLEGRTFYVHAWRVHYTELGIGDLRGPAELAEVAYDVGLQLGKGHPKAIADPHGADLRRELKGVVREVGPTLPSVAKEMAHRIVLAHAELKRSFEEDPP
ncbi:MAG: DUF2252 family protein [Polyangiaceae bacterium]|nr:DUF2252 family protein [Polyangiaceae bacterium]